MRRPSLAFLLARPFVSFALSACGPADDGVENPEDGVEAGDGDGDGDGDTGVSSTGGTASGDGDGDDPGTIMLPASSLSERAQNLDVETELAIAASLCRTQRVELQYSFDLENEDAQSSTGFLIEDSYEVAAADTETLVTVFTGEDGHVTLTWDVTDLDTDAASVIGHLDFPQGAGRATKCFAGIGGLAQEIDGEVFYTFVATQFVDAEGCGEVAIDVLGLTHGCISTELP